MLAGGLYERTSGAAGQPLGGYRPLGVMESLLGCPAPGRQLTPVGIAAEVLPPDSTASQGFDTVRHDHVAPSQHLRHRYLDRVARGIVQLVREQRETEGG